jgi:hypothetical protein
MILSLVLSLSCLASAETPNTWRAMMNSIGQPDEASSAAAPSYAQLEAAPAKPAVVFDGNKGKTKDGLLLTDEKKNVLLEKETIGGDIECDLPDGPRGGAPCHRTPQHTIKTYGDVRTYKVVDRKAYEKSLELKDGLIGGLIGVLAFLLVFANPIAGILAGIAAVAAGAAIGASIGKSSADGSPEVFTRKENLHSGF